MTKGTAVPETTPVGESSAVSFSLSFLLQLVAILVGAVWGYSQLDARIRVIQNSSAQHDESIDRIESTISLTQDQPISSDYVQNTNIKEILRRLDVIEHRMFDAYRPRQ